MNKFLVDLTEKDRILNMYKKMLKEQASEKSNVPTTEEEKSAFLSKAEKVGCLTDGDIVIDPKTKDVVYLKRSTRNPNNVVVYFSNYRYEIRDKNTKAVVEQSLWPCQAMKNTEADETTVANKGYYSKEHWLKTYKNIETKDLYNPNFFEKKLIGGVEMFKKKQGYEQTWNVKNYELTDKDGKLVTVDEFVNSLGQYNENQKEWFDYLVDNGLILKPTEIQLGNNELGKITIYEPGQNADFPDGLTAFVDRGKRVQLTNALFRLMNPNRAERKQEKINEENEQKACKAWIELYIEGYSTSDVNTSQKDARFRNTTPKRVKSDVQECAQKYYKNWTKLRRRDGEFLDQVLGLFLKRITTMEYKGEKINRPKINSDWQLNQVRR